MVFKQLGDHFSLSFCIQFFKQHVNIVFHCALAFAIERKIVLASDVCFTPLITIRSHDLHASDMRGVMGEIVPSCPFFWVLVGCASFGLSLAFAFVSHVMVLTIHLFLNF